MADLDPTVQAALTDAYWKLREYASTYRNGRPVQRVRERWENTGRRDPELSRMVAVHEFFARGVERAAQEIAEMLGVPEHEIEEPDLTP